MIRVYVAGAYSADNVMDVLHNMGAGIEESAELFAMGFAVFCPWLDFHFAMIRRDADKQLFYDYSMAWLEVSQIVYVRKGWEKSTGTINEIARADKFNIPVVYSKEELLEVAEDLK